MRVPAESTPSMEIVVPWKSLVSARGGCESGGQHAPSFACAIVGRITVSSFHHC
eukprot:m.299322 g.299322  ORF g.299322 m.299322 type:complete len:54 (+) comp16298_c0_seq22:2660-2821(+)